MLKVQAKDLAVHVDGPILGTSEFLDDFLRECALRVGSEGKKAAMLLEYGQDRVTLAVHDWSDQGLDVVEPWSPERRDDVGKLFGYTLTERAWEDFHAFAAQAGDVLKNKLTGVDQQAPLPMIRTG